MTFIDTAYLVALSMKQYQLTDALTSDEHFEQAGFRALMRNP